MFTRVLTSCLLARAAALAPATARPPRNSATPPWDPLDFIQTAGGVANKLHPVLNHLPPAAGPAPARVLDIGCALGPDLMRSGYDVRGMDVDARQVATARARRVPAVLGDAQVCFPPELRPRALFDAVVSLDALHHRPHHASAVADRAAFLDDYRTACAQRLGGENRLDFVRLRWRAVRRDDRSR